MTGERTWTVGELAEESGLSVRVLRHWDAMGVVSPSRARNGHRRYGPAEVTRLYRALSLRRTGLGLRPIATLLDEQDPDPAGTLRAHLAEVDDDLQRRGELRDRLAAALDHPAPGHLMRVIETMTMFEQYVHGYRPLESARLGDQAAALVDIIHGGVRYGAGERVLEVGCAVGAQTVVLAANNPEAHVVAVDLSAQCVAQTAGRVTGAGLRNVTTLEADVMHLPDPDGPLTAGTFDHVFVCFLLEHLKDPDEALRRLRRMLRPGGTITVIEGDHGSAYFHPDSAAAREAIASQVTLQRLAGGDALLGRRLYPLLHSTGWSDVSVRPHVVYVDGRRPDLGESFTRRTFTAMIAGVREPAIAAGLIDSDRFDAGIRDLERAAEPDGVFTYTFFRASAVAD